MKPQGPREAPISFRPGKLRAAIRPRARGPLTEGQIAKRDLGRYYLIQHSLRTVAAEAARMTLAYDNNSTATQPTTASFAAIAPFIDTSNLNVTVQQPNFSGVTIIMVTATYPFVAWSPLWSASLDGTISESTELQD